MVDILINTPKWVFFVFAYLMIAGIAATRDRRIRTRKLFLCPALLLTLFAPRLLSLHTVQAWLLFGVSFAIGLLFATVCLRQRRVQSIQGSLVLVKGSYTPLIVSLIVFSTKYVFSYKKAIGHYATSDANLETALFSCFVGISIGILALRLREIQWIKRHSAKMQTL